MGLTVFITHLVEAIIYGEPPSFRYWLSFVSGYNFWCSFGCRCGSFLGPLGGSRFHQLVEAAPPPCRLDRFLGMLGGSRFHQLVVAAPFRSPFWTNEAKLCASLCRRISIMHKLVRSCPRFSGCRYDSFAIRPVPSFSDEFRCKCGSPL